MTTIHVYRLSDDNDFEEIGRIEDGDIVAGEDALLAIDSRGTWTGMSPARLTQRFNGPRIMATEAGAPGAMDP